MPVINIILVDEISNLFNFNVNKSKREVCGHTLKNMFVTIICIRDKLDQKFFFTTILWQVPINFVACMTAAHMYHDIII